MSEPFLGQIQMFGFNFPPRGWSLCDGQLLPISQYSAVFSLLGTTFGGDGRTTFALPDLRGRNPVHVGTGPGLPQVRWGERAGTHTYPITVANLPPHHHAMRGSSSANDETNPTGGVPGPAPQDFYAETSNVNMGDTANTGSNTALNVTEPFLGIYHSIALQGLFPSRS